MGKLADIFGRGKREAPGNQKEPNEPLDAVKKAFARVETLTAYNRAKYRELLFLSLTNIARTHTPAEIAKAIFGSSELIDRLNRRGVHAEVKELLTRLAESDRSSESR